MRYSGKRKGYVRRIEHSMSMLLALAAKKVELTNRVVLSPMCLDNNALFDMLLTGPYHNTGGMTMDLKLTNLEAVAVMNALQQYVKYLEGKGDEKGVQIERKTVKGLISKIESMPAGEVQ
jgi:hypothetical protein